MGGLIMETSEIRGVLEYLLIIDVLFFGLIISDILSVVEDIVLYYTFRAALLTGQNMFHIVTLTTFVWWAKRKICRG